MPCIVATLKELLRHTHFDSAAKCVEFTMTYEYDREVNHLIEIQSMCVSYC